MDIQLAAWLAVALLVLGATFQMGLAAGAPWGAAAYGGRAVRGDGSLPRLHRLGSAVAAVVLAVLLVSPAGLFGRISVARA